MFTQVQYYSEYSIKMEDGAGMMNNERRKLGKEIGKVEQCFSSMIIAPE
jgi:hypothetical protein